MEKLKTSSAYSFPRHLGLALTAARRRRSVILAYHGFGRATRATDPRLLTVPVARFRAQVGALAAAGFQFVTVSELSNRLADGTGPLPGLVALTFDDGLLSVAEPLQALAAEGIPSTVYVVNDWIGGMHPTVGTALEAKVLEVEDLIALARAGIEIGGHTRSHRDLTMLSYRQCLAELGESRAALGALVGQPVSTLAYPWGRSTLEVRRAARDAGFKAAVAEGSGECCDRFALPRAPVLRVDDSVSFTLKVCGLWPSVGGSGPARLMRLGTRPARRWWQGRTE